MGANEIEGLYNSTLDSIQNLLSKFDHGIDFKNYLVDNPESTYQKTLIKLQLVTLKSDVLWLMNSFHASNITCWFGAQAWTRDSIISSEMASFSLESPMFSRLEDNYVVIDSCYRDEAKVCLNYHFRPRYSCGRIYFDSLQQGNYKIFGTVKNFLNDRELMAQFETEFEIKN
ncbi:MAG TPA: hypothetical protein DCG19_11445 [Cryomorphaceae bacterium]|mgnify:CR=1 FL=1|nr:hypothetical protein [Owenweeksia sp.]MBG00623.1 hypothetical protein [Owenweeksia sp.]HAD98012.1 hypothetical protein [Cryomorphaceae bacterium]HBF21090.1 hypothetical protein [Cryomorphaceae bacterium]HCQ15137.1 hypothetical protein [Cryomorphaceae bacterium]|tara:strand:- start:622 stop:1137 length:516 start_codon:yes stop_codon:yes gene_type:complete